MSLLAQKVERLTQATIPAFKPLLEAFDGAKTYTQSRRAVRRAQEVKPPPTLKIETALADGRAEAKLHTMLWALSPAEKSEEVGLNVEMLLVRITRQEKWLLPAPVTFVSVHAINRLQERLPRTTPQDVFDLAWRFVQLNARMALDEVHFKGDPKGSGILRIGQQYARSNVMLTESVRCGYSAVWQDVRTVVGTDDPAVLAHARACESAIDHGTPVPFLPRRDSYTLGTVRGTLVN